MRGLRPGPPILLYPEQLPLCLFMHPYGFTLPQMSKSIPEETVFPALPRRSRRGSTHTTVARGTALLESLVGKPQWKATDPLIHTSASVTLLLQVVRKWQVHAPTRDED